MLDRNVNKLAAQGFKLMANDDSLELSIKEILDLIEAYYLKAETNNDEAVRELLVNSFAVGLALGHQSKGV